MYAMFYGKLYKCAYYVYNKYYHQQVTIFARCYNNYHDKETRTMLQHRRQTTTRERLEQTDETNGRHFAEDVRLATAQKYSRRRRHYIQASANYGNAEKLNVGRNS